MLYLVVVVVYSLFQTIDPYKKLILLTYIKIKHVSTIKHKLQSLQNILSEVQRFYMESNRYMFLENKSLWPVTS